MNYCFLIPVMESGEQGEIDTDYVSVHIYTSSGVIEKVTTAVTEEGSWKFGEHGGWEIFFCVPFCSLKILIYIHGLHTQNQFLKNQS